MIDRSVCRCCEAAVPILRIKSSQADDRSSFSVTASSRPGHWRRRPAWTLIELMVVLTVSSLLVGIVITTLLVLVRTDRSWRNESASQNELRQLADIFRRDVHRAERVAIEDGAEEIEIGLPENRTIAYRRDGERLVRTEKLGDSPFETMDVFRLGSRAEIRFDEVTANESHVATMTVFLFRPNARMEKVESPSQSQKAPTPRISSDSGAPPEDGGGGLGLGDFSRDDGGVGFALESGVPHRFDAVVGRDHAWELP